VEQFCGEEEEEEEEEENRGTHHLGLLLTSMSFIW
jgi:hypothetical protein